MGSVHEGAVGYRGPRGIVVERFRRHEEAVVAAPDEQRVPPRGGGHRRTVAEEQVQAHVVTGIDERGDVTQRAGRIDDRRRVGRARARRSPRCRCHLAARRAVPGESAARSVDSRSSRKPKPFSENDHRDDTNGALFSTSRVVPGEAKRAAATMAPDRCVAVGERRRRSRSTSVERYCSGAESPSGYQATPQPSGLVRPGG